MENLAKACIHVCLCMHTFTELSSGIQPGRGRQLHNLKAAAPSTNYRCYQAQREILQTFISGNAYFKHLKRTFDSIRVSPFNSSISTPLPLKIKSF